MTALIKGMALDGAYGLAYMTGIGSSFIFIYYLMIGGGLGCNFAMTLLIGINSTSDYDFL